MRLQGSALIVIRERAAREATEGTEATPDDDAPPSPRRRDDRYYHHHIYHV